MTRERTAWGSRGGPLGIIILLGCLGGAQPTWALGAGGENGSHGITVTTTGGHKSSHRDPLEGIAYIQSLPDHSIQSVVFYGHGSPLGVVIGDHSLRLSPLGVANETGLASLLQSKMAPGGVVHLTACFTSTPYGLDSQVGDLAQGLSLQLPNVTVVGNAGIIFDLQQIAGWFAGGYSEPNSFFTPILAQRSFVNGELNGQYSPATPDGTPATNPVGISIVVPTSGGEGGSSLDLALFLPATMPAIPFAFDSFQPVFDPAAPYVVPTINDPIIQEEILALTTPNPAGSAYGALLEAASLGLIPDWTPGSSYFTVSVGPSQGGSGSPEGMLIMISVESWVAIPGDTLAELEAAAIAEGHTYYGSTSEGGGGGSSAEVYLR